METKHPLLLAQIAKRGPYIDCALLRPLIDIAHQVMPASWVLADREFDSELNHRHIREVHHMKSVIPARKYSPRNLIETVFSVGKRKLSTRALGRSLATQALQTLILGLAYNLYKL